MLQTSVCVLYTFTVHITDTIQHYVAFFTEFVILEINTTTACSLLQMCQFNCSIKPSNWPVFNHIANITITYTAPGIQHKMYSESHPCQLKPVPSTCRQYKDAPIGTVTILCTCNTIDMRMQSYCSHVYSCSHH